MPKFHFYLVTEDDREHIGSIELPNRGAVIPAGLKITTEILTSIVRRHPEENGLQVQTEDEAGAVVYTFTVSPRPEGHDRPTGYLH